MRFGSQLIMAALVALTACLPDHSSGRHEQSHAVSDKPVRVGLVLSHFGLGDQSFNDMQYNGLIEAFRRFEIHTVFRVPKSETDADMRPVFEELINREQCNVIIAGEGFQMGPLVYELARKYPDVHFIVFEYKAGVVPNVVNAEFAQNEGSYAAGFLAARFSASKKIAFIGGVDIAVIKDFESGFRQGMSRGDPACMLVTEYVSRLPDYSGFYDPKKGYALARRLYSEGVDIIYAVAGGTGNGVIQAARETGKYVIGVDSNQDHMAPGQVLTSMMKRLDVAVLRLIELRIRGKLQGGVHRFDYRNGGVSLTEMEYTSKMLPSDLIRELHEIEKQIADGVITVINTLKG